MKSFSNYIFEATNKKIEIDIDTEVKQVTHSYKFRNITYKMNFTTVNDTNSWLKYETYNDYLNDKFGFAFERKNDKIIYDKDYNFVAQFWEFKSIEIDGYNIKQNKEFNKKFAIDFSYNVVPTEKGKDKLLSYPILDEYATDNITLKEGLDFNYITCNPKIYYPHSMDEVMEHLFKNNQLRIRTYGLDMLDFMSIIENITDDIKNQYKDEIKKSFPKTIPNAYCYTNV